MRFAHSALVTLSTLAFISISAFAVPLAAQTGSIEGRVTDELAAAVGGIGVQLEAPDGAFLGATTTAGDGTYAFTGLADGTYLIWVGSDAARDLVGRYYDGVNEHDRDLATHLEILGGNALAGIDLQLPPASSLSGTLYGLAAGEVVGLQLTDAATGRYRGGATSDPATSTFTITGLLPGRYQLFADPAGTDRAVQWYDGRTAPTRADAITVGRDEDVVGIDLTLGAGTSISGTVSLSPDPGDGGATLSRLSMVAMDPQTHEWVHERGVSADSTYTLDNLPPGTYVVQALTHDTSYVQEVWVPGADDPLQAPVFSPGQGQPVTVDAGLPATGVDFLLERGRSITGHVFLESVAVNGIQDAGEPDVTWTWVNAGLLDGSYGRGTSTDGQGDYTLTGLPPGRYEVNVQSSSVDAPFVAERWDDHHLDEPADTVDVTAGDVSGIDFGVARERAISGRLFVDLNNDGAQQADEPPLSWVSVRAYDATTGYYLGDAAVGPDGRYSVGVPAGLYHVEADPHSPNLIREYWRNVYSHAEAEAVDARGSDPAGIDFGILDGASVGTLRGRVVAAGALAPLAGVEVQASRFQDGSWLDGTFTDADGRFAFTNLPPGSFKVFFDTRLANAAGDTDFVPSFWSASGSAGDTDPANLQVAYPAVYGDGTDLGTFALVTGGSISGRVYPPAGEALPLPFEVGVEELGGGGLPLPGASVAADGSYHLRGLPAPASYRVRAALWNTELIPVYYATATESTFDSNRATAVAVETGTQTPGIDLHLLRGGSISGRITRAADGSPVAGFPVSADLQNPSGAGFWAHATSDQDGFYTLLGLPSGDYEVRTDTRSGELANETYPSPVSVAAPGDTTGVDFALEVSGTIRGRVTRHVGAAVEPVVGVRVEAQDAGSGRFVSDGYTDSSGDYAIQALAQGHSYRVRVQPQESTDPGVYDLIAEYYDGELLASLATPVTIPADAGGTPVEVASIDFELTLGGAIAGTVTVEGTGQPLPGACIHTYLQPSNEDVASPCTGGDGAYIIRGLPAGEVHLQANPWPQDFIPEYYDGVLDQSLATAVSVPAVPAGGPIPVTEGVNFALAPGLTISGRVTEADGVTPIAGLQVSAYGQDVPHGGGATTAADGTYRIGGLGAGHYRVAAETTGTAYAPASRSVDLTAGSVTGVDFALGPGAAIRGRTYEDVAGANGTYDPGEERSGVWIQVYDFDTGEWIGNTTSGADGRYALSGLAAGRYEVRVEPDEQNFVRMVWQDSLTQATPVVIATVGGVPQDATGIDFRLLRGTEIHGLVFLDSDGDGLRDAGEPGVGNAWVNAWQVDGPYNTWGGTRSDGTYTLHGVLPGRYQVAAGATGLIQEYFDDVFFAQEATSVDVTAGAASGIDFSLVDGASLGTLRGRVLAADTLAGIPGVEVGVWRFDDDSGVASTSTDASGRFAFTDLPPSPAAGYKVFFDTSQANEAHDTDHVSSFWAASGQPGVIDSDLLRVDYPTLPDPPTGPGTDLGDFTLEQGGSIAGTVYPPLGETLPPFLGVSAQSFESGGGHLPGAQVDATGHYRIRGLPAPATYRVQASTWGTDYVPVYYLDATESTFDYDTAAPVGVEVGAATAGIDLHLTRGGAIAGQITRAADGSPVAGFPVYTYLVDDPLGRNFWGGHTSTASDGTYRFTGLPGGSYVVRTDGRDTDLANQTYPAQVPVTAGQETAGIDFALEAAGRIRGRVTQVVDGNVEPVVNIRVQADDYTTGEFASDAHTGADGTYSIGSLAQGASYRVQVMTQDGPDPQFFNFVPQLYDHRLLWHEADPVAVPVSSGGSVSEVSGIDFELTLGGAISGLVRSEATGEPRQNVSVWAEDFAGSDFGNGDTTDHNGFYIIRGLPDGPYRVQANPWPQDFVQEYFDDVTDRNQATAVSVAPVPAGGPIPITEHIDFDLAAAFRISGRVTEADGVTPIPGLYVWAEGPGFYADTNTRTDGSYEIRGLPAGAYTVGVETGGTDFIRQQQGVDLTAGSAAGVDFALMRGAAIRGRAYVDADGNGAYDAGEERSSVYLWAEDFDTGWWIADGTSAADGTYAIRGLTAGTYRVQMEPDERNFVRMVYDNAFSWQDATPVEVTEDAGGTPQDATGIDFRLLQGQEIRGRVFYDADGDGLQDDGEPGLGNLGINAQTSDGLFSGWGGSGPDGTYAVHGLYPGRYEVWVHADGTPYAGEFYRSEGGVPMGTWRYSELELVDVTAGDAAGIDFSLELGGGMTGTVRDATTGEPLSRVSLNAEPFDGDGLWGWSHTDGEGRYSLRGLPPGSYRLSAWDDDGAYVAEYHADAIFWQDAAPVQVAARSTVSDPLATQVDFDLDRGGSLSGFVYHDANGNGAYDAGEPALGGIDVAVEEAASPNRYLSGARTAADGTYQAGGLPPGVPLRVSVWPYPTDFLPVFYDGGDDRGAMDSNAALAVTVAAGTDTPGIRFGLELGGAISGTVVDGDGQGIGGLHVSAHSYDFTLPGGGANTDADGHYTIHGLATGCYRVDAGGDPYAYELYDDREEWRLADPVAVSAGATTTGIDFVLPRLPRIVSGPAPAAGERGSTVTGVTLVAEGLVGEPAQLCSPTPEPPCVRLELAGSGAAFQNLTLDAASGTFTFDLALAADAPLGQQTLAVINDQQLEDGVALLANAFDVQPAAVGDVPAPSTHRLYTTDTGTSELQVYGTADHALLGTLPVCSNPASVDLSPDASFAFVTCGDRSLSVVDTRLGPVGREVARTPVIGPWGPEAVEVTDRYLYAIDRETGQGRVQVVDLTTWEHALDIPIDAAAWALRQDPAGKTLYAPMRYAHSVAVVDVDPASPTFHTVLATVPLPAGSYPRGVAFTPDGSRAWVVGLSRTYVLDTAAAVSDPANAVLATLETQGSGSGLIDIAHHPASGKDLAYLRVGDSIWVLDASPALPEPRVLRSFTPGLSPSGLRATPDRLYISHGGASLDLYAVETAGLLAGDTLDMTRFDGADGSLALAGDGLAVGRTPNPPPAGAPQVTLAAGSPAANGAPFTITLTGGPFAPEATVWLRGTHVRGSVTAATSTQLTVDLPATTPTGRHTVVVSNPAAGGGASGESTTPLEVVAPAGFAPAQTLYASSYGTAEVVVLEPDGSRGSIATQPLPGGLAVTPDGRQAFVVQLYASPWLRWDELPESYLDMTVVDLEEGSPTHRQVVATIPWVWSGFAAPAVTPDAQSPNGVYVYAPNYYMADTVSVLDPVTRTEVDIDDDPATQSIPPYDPYTWIYGEKLPGITRIELDDQVTDWSLAPIDSALTPDGTLLYVADWAGSVSVVDTVSRQVVHHLTHPSLLRARGVTVTPTDAPAGVFVYVSGYDAQGRASLFVFEAGVLDDAAAFVDQIVLPEPELPREISITADGATVYLSARFLGELWAVDVRPAQRGAIERIPLAPGIHEALEAPEDQLLYVSNGFRNEIYVLDLAPGAGRHGLITTLGFPSSPVGLAVQPALGTAKPQVSRVTPTSGSPDGGDPVVVTGANFAAGATVEIGTRAATGVVVEDAFTLRAVTPPSDPPGSTGPVEVKVINPDGKTGVLQGGFRYVVDTTPPTFTTPPYVAAQALVGDPGAETATATVRWRTDEASTSVVDYRRAGDPTFSQQGDAALVQTHVVTLTGLEPGTAYELRATSVDAQGNAATSPAEPAVLSFTTPSAPDVTPPVIISGPTVSVTTDSALIQWQTDEVASSTVHYDAQLGDGTLDRRATGADATLHSVTLTGLAANTEHEYQALSSDPSGNGPVASAVLRFRTAALPDATPPVITAGPEVSYLSNDLVIVFWETDEPATSFVHYGVSSVDEEGVVDLDLVTSHVVFLTNLLPGTAYGYQAGSTDASGNTVLTADPFLSPAAAPLGAVQLQRTLHLPAVTLAAGTRLAWRAAAAGFTTPEAPDTQAPAVLSVSATALSFDRVLVTVESDEAASLAAHYGLGGLTASAFEPAFRTTSSLLLTGLQAGATYQLSVVLADPKGNATTVDGLTFTTPAAPDTQPPAVAGLTVEAVTDTAATLAWTTGEPADATVRFGPQGGALDQQVGRLGLVTSHRLVVTGLVPQTAYAFQVISRDASGNAGTAAGTFTTRAPAPRITSVVPSRAAQGAATEVVINGAHFGVDSQVELGAGVTVGSLSVNAVGSQIRAALAVDGAAPAGERQLTVITGGHTVSAPFSVVDASVPVVTITEPADGTELVDTLTLTVGGTVSEAATVLVNGGEATVTGGDPITFEASVTLPDAGLHRILVTATDASGNRGTAVVVVGVTFTDTEPPTLALAATPSVLWPPNHKMVQVVVDVAVDDDQDPAPEVVLLSVASNEADDASGDGDGETVADIQGAEVGTDDRELLLRAERDGGGTGRVYTLTYRATDRVGNAAEASVEVTVPHDRR